MDSSIYTLLISCFTWSTLYFTLCLVNPRRSYEWHIRTVTVVHAITVVLLGAWCVFVEGPWPFTNLGGRSTPFQTFIVTVCLGYFLLDLSWCLYFRTEGPVMLLHHSLSIAGFSTCVVLDWWGTEMVATILGAELTNPLLQWRWFLRETGKYETRLGDYVDIAFMVLFGVLRIGFGTVLIGCYYSQDTDGWGRFGGTAIYLIGWVFFVNIVQYGIKKYKKRNSKVSEAKKLETSDDISSEQEVSTSEKENGDINANGELKHRHLNGYVQKASLVMDSTN